MIYVLIAIVLFAALSMTLGRQTDNSEASDLDDGKAELYATQLIAYATQAKSAVDQMMFSSTSIDELDFTLPSEAGFNSAPTMHKVFHPDGGGLNAVALPEQAIDQNIADPVAGWYMGRFENVEWTETSGTDVILIAYQVKKKICEKINQNVTGTTTIPQLTTTIRNVFIDDAIHAGGNVELTTDPAGTPICATCHKRASLCVEDVVPGTYGFYTILADR